MHPAIRADCVIALTHAIQADHLIEKIVKDPIRADFPIEKVLKDDCFIEESPESLWILQRPVTLLRRTSTRYAARCSEASQEAGNVEKT